MFKRARFAREVNNFLSKIEQYFRVEDIKDDNAKVNTIARYFINFALLWWKRRSTNEKRGQAVIGTWKEFRNEFNEQFYPQYVEKEARSKLRRFSQQGLLRTEAFFHFMDELKPWVKQELECRVVQKLLKAMIMDDEPKKAPMRLGSIVHGVDSKKGKKS
ncbi:hypothetical protein Godav_006563 [Gossypium davidsonii]|uniref:Retrotransposon gag domain-containing protein n=1 Tax=Gossypium davidsonii TaxID=34287 RepID=A0A7J8S5N0_GOSDV|nr:hypothetical protein [Gossypium davidsonii]